jgi:hypothetical protein
MRLRIERPRGRGLAKGLDRLAVTPLPGERHSEVKRRIRVVRAPLEHDTKRPLRLGEILLLQVLPPVGERRIDER